MAYSHEDYLNDCLIVKVGSGGRSVDAKVRKDFWELNRVDLIYKNYPEFRDSPNSYSKKGVYDDLVLPINDRVYTSKHLTEWLDYPENSNIRKLLVKRSNDLKQYKAFYENYLKTGNDKVMDILEYKAKDLMELENEIQHAKNSQIKKESTKAKKNAESEANELVGGILIFIVLGVIGVYVISFIWDFLDLGYLFDLLF